MNLTDPEGMPDPTHDLAGYRTATRAAAAWLSAVRFHCWVWGVGLTLLSAVSGWAATVTWDGGGGDFSWQNPTNWSSDTLPGVNDDVVINVSNDVTVTSAASVTILSLRCSNNLALSAGTFRVRMGNSVVQGRVSTTGNPILSATGALTSFTLAGPVNADGAGFEANNAILSVPGLSTYSKAAGCAPVMWTASGANGVVVFPSLTVVTGAACANLTIQALNGGKLLLTNLTTTTEGFTSWVADGSNSLVDLPSLQRSTGSDRTVSFEARNNGTISMPQFTGGQNVTVTLKTGGAMPVAQLTELSGLAVTGLNVSFPALTNLTGGNVTVDGGSVLSATNLVRHSGPPGCVAHTWLATGVGSVLDLSNLTNLGGPTCGFLNVQATAGGNMTLSNLTNVTEGYLNFLADGTNSLLDLAALNASLAAVRPISFAARNTGRITMPQFTGGAMVVVALGPGGVLPVEQLTQLRGFTVTGMAAQFAALTNLTGGDVTVDGGGMVTAPMLTRHDESIGCYGHSWEASGEGSVLDLSQLATLIGPGCGVLNITAASGGTVSLGHLAAVGEGTVEFFADGTNSLLDLSALAETPGTARVVSFDARNAGTILTPLLSGGPAVTVSLQTSGVLPVTQLRQLRGFSVNGMSLSFLSLTNLTAGNVTVSGGAQVTAPILSRYDPGSCVGQTWLATGAGSLLDFPGITSLTGPECGYLNLQATTGGVFRLGNLNTVVEGTLFCLADGANSRLDLANLAAVQATARTVSFEARNSGAMTLPLLRGGPAVTVALKSGGSMDVTQMTELQRLSVSGTTLILTGLTNVASGDITVTTGAVLRLPGLASHTQTTGCAANTWLASGAGSVLDLSSLTNLGGDTCGSLTVKALAGGAIIASDLQSLADGTLYFIGDGTNSLIDLPTLEQSLGTYYPVSFEVGSAGEIRMPQMTGGATVSVTVKTNGLMPVAQFSRLGGINVTGTNLDFPGLSNFDGGSLSASNAAVVTAANLLSYTQGDVCSAPRRWIVSGAGSVVSLPGLTELRGGQCVWLEAQALSGGHLLLASLTHIPAGDVRLLSSGDGSLIDLRALASFLNPALSSRLAATNGGTLWLSGQPVILSGVTLDIAAGTPDLPPANFAATSLLMHGAPWRSYWIERRDTTSPTNPWIFGGRVPLAADFQVIGPPAPANREFRVWEFVADPYLLDLNRLGTNVQLVLYAPTNRTLDVSAATNLTRPAVWTRLDSVTMTNTFRIFPPEPATLRERYFKVEVP